MADDGADEKFEALKALLESISTPNPALRVHGVVKTPDVEGKPSKDGELLPVGVEESELPPPLLGGRRKRGRVVQRLLPAVIPFLITRKGVRPRGRPIILDDPALDEEGKRQAYAALARIPWLHPKIRTAINKHGLRQAVTPQNAAANLRDRILLDDVERHELALQEAGELQADVKAKQEVARKHWLVFDVKGWKKDWPAALETAGETLRRRLNRYRNRNHSR